MKYYSIMPPSKKKSHHRGKARRGGNSKKVGEKKDEAPDLQMERLKIDKDSQKEKADEDAALEEAIKLAAAEKEPLDAAAAEIERSMTEKKATKRSELCSVFMDTSQRRITS